MSNNSDDDDDDNDNDDNDDDNNNDDNDITFLYFRLRSPPLATDGVLFCDFLDAAGLPKIGPLSSSLSLPSLAVVGFLLNVLRSNVST